MKNKTWLYNILLLTSIVSGSIFLINNEIVAKPELSNVYNNDFLPQDIVFEFSSPTCEEVFNLHSNLLELDEFNKLTLSFQVNGRSTYHGLTVVFILNAVTVRFTIDRAFQDGFKYNLTETFIFPSQYTGSLDITIICRGQSTSTNNGTLIIFNTTKIEQVNIPTVSENSSLLPISQDWVMFEGNRYSWNTGGFTSAFYNYNEIALVSLNLSFFSNFFQSLENLVETSLNGNIIAEDYFIEDSRNEINIQFQPEIGLNLLTINFSVSYSSQLIFVSDISLFGSLFHYESSSPALDSFTWEGDFFTYSFDLSSLKPPGYYSEQVLQLTINYQFFGMKIFSGINYFLKMGTTILKEGTISYIEQMYESNSLKIDSFTEEYHNSLSFTILGSSSGVGGFTILKSSTIEIANIKKLAEQPMSRLVADERTVGGPSISTIISFYDVFQTIYVISSIELAINFHLFSDYEHPFDFLTVTIKINGKAELSKNVYELGFTNFSTTLSLSMGYHEIKIILQFTGINTPLKLEQLTYQLALLEEEVIISTTPSYAPHSYFYLLGFYGFLYFVSGDKRLFRGRIKRSRTDIQDDSTIDMNEEDRSRLRSFLTIATFLIIFVGSSVLFFILRVNFWTYFPLNYIIAMHLSIKIALSNITKSTFIEFWKRTGGFFEDIDSFYDLIHKSIGLLKKLSLRSLTVFLVLLIAFLNFGLLFFLTDNIPSTADQGVWRVYALLLACIFFSSLTLFYTLHFTRNMAFVEDNLKRIKYLGIVSIVLVVGSLVVLVSILDTKLSLSSIWGFLSPVLFVLLFRNTTKLGKMVAKDEQQTYDDFLEKGRFWTNKKEVRKAVSFGIVTRSAWEKKGLELQKHQVICVITYDLNPGDEINIFELAEKTKIPIKITKKLIQEIETTIPKLGTYDLQSKIYTKSEKISVEPVNSSEKIVPDKYGTEEKNVEMSKEPKENTSTKERFQLLYEGIVGESEEEKKGTLEYVNHLTPKEAEVYLKFLKKGLGELNVDLTDVDIEFLQKALKKLMDDVDTLKRNLSSNLLKEIYDSLEDRSHGFDDVIFIKNQDRFSLTFVEYKGGDYVALHPWDYIPKKAYNKRRLELNKKQLLDFIAEGELANTPISNEIRNLKGSKVPLFIFKLYYDRNRQYHGIGNDWLIKFRNGDFTEAMNMLVKNRVLSELKNKRITNGLLEQNEIIALAQNGHIIRKSKNATFTLHTNTNIKFDGEKTTFSYNFFMPKFEKKGLDFVLSLNGFSGNLSEKQTMIQGLIPHEKLKKRYSDDKLLIIYTRLKRKFLMNLFNTKKLDNLVDLEDGRAKYALETLVSKSLSDRIHDWFDNFDNRRGISWFYDYAYHLILDFIHPNDLRKMFERSTNNNIFTELTDLLIDSEYLFDSDKEYYRSKEVFEKHPFIFFLNDTNNKMSQYPPKFNFWDYNKPPSIGIVLVNEENELLYHKPETGGLSSAKIMGIQLLEEEILLNFPFRWDHSAGGYIFGRHSKDTSKFTVIGKAWSKWLKNNNLTLPIGPSAKIHDESVIAMLLEWIKRINNFINERIVKSQDFTSLCKKESITIDDKQSSKFFFKDKIAYRLAKVSMGKGGRLRHLGKWKLFEDPKASLNKLFKVLKALICDITLREKKIKSESVDNFDDWLRENWLEEFSTIKHYFYLNEN